MIIILREDPKEAEVYLCQTIHISEFSGTPLKKPKLCASSAVSALKNP
jgi:hypothetical protein